MEDEVPGMAAAKRFPLRLCEVLEKEFVTTHGPLSRTPDWLLHPSDVDARKLQEVLEASPQGENAEALGVLREKLFRGMPPPAAGPWTAAFDEQILVRMNELLRANEELYDPAMLDVDSAASQLAELQARQSTFQWKPARRRTTAQYAEPGITAEQDERMQLNRMLLEAAVPPAAVARVDTSRLTALYKDVAGLRGPDGIRSALCLSGGGIRSAAFGLGVVGALARRGVLEKFDFLSTVSGGGYVGSWLSTWIHRHPQGLPGVVNELSMRAQVEARGLTTKTEPAPAPVRFLRDYSHFLNPKSGLFTADTWTWAGIYLRNLTLNWLVIIPFLLLVLSAPRLYAALAYSWRAKYGTQLYGEGSLFPWLIWLTGLAVMMTLVCINVHRPSVTDTASPDARPQQPPGPIQRRLDRVRGQLSRQVWLLLLGVLPLFAFAIALTLLVWGLPPGKSDLSWVQIRIMLEALPPSEVVAALGRLGFEHLLIWGELIILASWIVSIPLLPRRGWGKRIKELVAMLFAGFITWSIIAMLAEFAAQVGSEPAPAFTLGGFTAYPAHVYTVVAVPVVIGAALAGMTLFIGAVSKFQWIEDEDREWWARFGAWTLIVMVGWLLLSTVAIFGPPLLLEFPRIISALGGISGLFAVLVGKSSLTAALGPSNSGSKGPAERAAPAMGGKILAGASAVFLLVFLAFLSLLTSAALDAFFGWISAPPDTGEMAVLGALRDLFPSDLAPFRQACGLQEALPWGAGVFGEPAVHLEIVCQTRLRVIFTIIAGLVAFLGVASAIVNLNKFSLHAAYRIRIVRTFLGASRASERRPNAFTGFDPLDDVQMHELQSGLLREGDIGNLGTFVAMLRDAMAKVEARPPKNPAQALAQLMCRPAYDPSSVLKTRLQDAKPNAAVLKSLQQDVRETLNRVIETVRLDRIPVFQALAGDPQHKPAAEAAKRFYRQGNLIFGNRMLVELAFPGVFRKYEFPPPPPHKLLHVINLTLNLVQGSKLAWQERKAAPFAVTPMHAGNYYLGFRNSREYGGENGISIGTAVAVSGAAVSPNMGYSSSALTGILLTLFNVRLGWWLGNPGVGGADTYRLAEPRLLLRPLWSEAFGLTNDRSPYVYLSDGGHFENMGLFEMVLRRCRFIVVSDAGADPDYQFEDLGNAVRKIRIDLGIPIEFESIPIRRSTGPEDDAGRYCAIGRIRYSTVDGEEAPDGLLVCFKPVLCGKEPRDVLHYAAKHPTFPQEPTSNQFYGESQFESYRQLGEAAVETAFGEKPAIADMPWVAHVVGSTRAYLGNAGKAAWIDAWLAGLK
jgi:hypothetical protein